MRRNIEFRDLAQKPTTDYVNGWPTIEVLIDVGFVPPAEGQSFTPNYQRLRAIIDTGANAIVVSPWLVVGKTPLNVVPGGNQTGRGSNPTYRALFEIEGFFGPRQFEVGAHNTPLAYDVLIGRDVLSYFRMVYDTPQREFYLEV